MSYVIELLLSVLRIMFLRGSPERIYYTRRLFLVSLLLAIAVSAAAQLLFHGDHIVFVILRVFAEVTVFMMMMVLFTAKVGRFRLARMMLVLVLISLLADSVLVALSPLPLGEMTQAVAYATGAVAFYGAASAMSWGLSRPLWQAAAYLLGYVVAVYLLDTAFRSLYDMYVAAT